MPRGNFSQARISTSESLHRRGSLALQLLTQTSWVDLHARPQGNRDGWSLSSVRLTRAVDTGVEDARVLVNDLLDEEAVDVTGR